MNINVLVTALVCTIVPPATWAQENACPSGMVWGGHRCEWKNLCPNGKPSVPGHECELPSGTQSEPMPIDPPIEICSPNVVFFQAGIVVRRGPVFLSGKDLVGLLAIYETAVRAAGGTVNFEELSVLFLDESRLITLMGGRDVKMELGSLFAGYTYRQLWERKLREGKGERVSINHVSKILDSLRSDFVCEKISS